MISLDLVGVDIRDTHLDAQRRRRRRPLFVSYDGVLSNEETARCRC